MACSVVLKESQSWLAVWEAFAVYQKHQRLSREQAQWRVGGCCVSALCTPTFLYSTEPFLPM